MKTAIRPLHVLAALAALITAIQTADAQDTVQIPAVDNNYVLRSGSGPTTAQTGTNGTLLIKRLNDSNTRIVYARFNLTSFLANHSANTIISARVRLFATANLADSIFAWGLLEQNQNSVLDSAWSPYTINFGNQPANTGGANNVPNSATALPNANTTATLGSGLGTTTAGELDITITNLSAFTTWLGSKTDQQVTLILCNASANNGTFSIAGLENTGGNLVPTLEIVANPTGGPTITGTNVWKGTVDGTSWDAGTLNWATTGGTQTNYLQGSYAIFDDTAGNNTNINLSITATNGGILVSNTSAHYIWTGPGNIVGQGGLTKTNSGALIIANTIANTFFGGVDLQAGIIQVGNGNTDIGAGNLGSGGLTNNGVLLVNMGSGGSVTLANAISGAGTFTNLGAGTLTLNGNSSYSSGLQIQAGAVRAESARALGAGTTFVNTNTTLVLGASVTNSITLANATLATANGNQTIATNSELLITTGTTNVLRSGDPLQNQTTSRDFGVDARLRGGGTIVVKNADGVVNPDGNQGVRFRNANAVSDFTGTIIVTNGAKGEILVVGAGPFSPINTGKLQFYAGNYTGGNATTASDPGGYTEFNIRNNGTGNTIINNDLEVLGTVSPGSPNAVVVNSIGNAVNGSVNTMGNLKIGDTQELIGYRAAGAITNTVQFSSVTLNGGTATFSPHSQTFGAAAQAGTDFILNNVTEAVAGSALTMNGLGNLTLAGTSTYTGPTLVQAGKLYINGFHTGVGVVTNASGSTLGGNGTNSGVVEVDGNLAPGTLGTAGTFGAPGGLVLKGALVFDIGANNTVGGGVNDLVEAGNLDLSAGTATVVVNPLVTAPQAGIYRLIDYTSTNGTFAADPAPVARLQFHLDYSVPNQINLSVSGGPAVSRWISTGDGTWDSGGTPNWTTNNTTSPATQFQQNDTVVFDDLVSGAQTNISLNQAVTVAWMTNNSALNSYTISGTGSINGPGGLVKLGNSSLALLTTNGFSGPVTISGGTVKILTAANGLSSLGALPGGAVTISGGGTLDLGGSPTANAINFTNAAGLKQFFVSGSGVGGNGAIVNSVNTNQQNAFQLITLTGNAAFGGIGRWDMRGATNPVLDLAGFKLTKTGSNQISLVSPLVTSGDIDINLGVLSFETGTIVTNSGTITVNPNGSIGHFRQFAGLFTRPIVLNGGTYTNLAGGGSTNDSPINVAANSTLSCVSGNDLYLRGPISGSFGLTKINSGNVIFTGTNTYSGNTIISNGSLTLVDSAILTNTATVLIASGATLDVLQRSNSVPAKTFTVATNQTLNDSGNVLGQVVVSAGGVMTGNGTVASNLTVNAGGFLLPGGTNGIGRITVGVSPTLSGRTVIEIDKSNLATNDQVFGSGPVVYGGTLTVTNIGPALASGDVFKIFNGSSFPTFFTLDLANPGPGLSWVTNQLNVSGILSVTSNVAPGPTNSASITSVTRSGTNLLVHGTNNNVPNTSFHFVVLQSTDLLTPLSNWTPVLTNPFNPDGTFDFTNPIVPGTPRQFIDVKAVP